MAGKLKTKLEDLLTDFSFVRFIKETCTAYERDFWLEWQYKNKAHEELVSQAKELILFINKDIERLPDPNRELKKLEDLQNTSSGSAEQTDKDFFKIHMNFSGFWPKTALVISLLIFSFGITHAFILSHNTEDLQFELISNDRFLNIEPNEVIWIQNDPILHINDTYASGRSGITREWNKGKLLVENVAIQIKLNSWCDKNPPFT